MLLDKVSYKKAAPYIFVVALIFWILCGIVIPVALLKYGYLNKESMEALSPFGDMFGGANSLFASFALVMLVFSIIIQYQSFVSQREQSALQGEILKKTLTMQIIMPLMDEIGGEEMRDAIIILTKFRNENSDFKNKFKDYKRFGIGEFDDIDKARRKFVKVFHTVSSLYAAKIIDEEAIKTFIRADHVWILKNISEPLEQAIRDNYSKDMFNLADKLYPISEIDELGVHKK